MQTKLYSRRVADGGTVELFVQHILNGQAFGSNVKFILNYHPSLAKISW
jgi:phosphate transport system substrate-binding protein